MKKTALSVLLIILATVAYSVATYTSNENLVARLDDKEITIAISEEVTVIARLERKE
jgi:hypothetical protein